MKNQGISLITLIITIIVIIILAAIVIFTGLRTPDSAQFSAFTNDVDTVYTAMVDKFADLKVEHAVKGDYRTNEQIYLEIASNDKTNNNQYTIMGIDTPNRTGTNKIPEHANNTTRCELITQTNGKSEGLDITLPKVREKQDSWYVTSDGRIFNATGFTYNKKTYFNASYYADGEKVTTHSSTRAGEICAQMFSSTPYATGKSVFEVKVTQ